MNSLKKTCEAGKVGYHVIACLCEYIQMGAGMNGLPRPSWKDTKRGKKVHMPYDEALCEIPIIAYARCGRAPNAKIMEGLRLKILM